ncbi:hypothetical protein DYGSA30_36730 [Dyella sp. GSA-30]|nr:hypothetical protein DYGSA30_36730 [Dyella sp. GSA-30]
MTDMKTYPHRHLPGVATPEAVDEAFAAVEATFNAIWLNQPGARSRLQRVWGREDHLANLELYTLGQGILSLRAHSHDDWLKKTAQTIRKSPQSHGLITEIITHATLRLGDQPFAPAPQKQPGYDFSLTSSGGDEYLVSIKNHDVTDDAKAFSRQASQLRKAWRSRLTHAKRSLGLTVAAEEPMTEADFEQVRQHIRGPNAFCQEKTMVSRHVRVRTAPLPYASGELAHHPVSDLVLVLAPASTKEQTRFAANLRSAAQRFKNVPRHPQQWRIVHMRVHAMADIAYLEQLANALLQEPDAGIDAIHIHQPTYARDAEGRSLIHHAFKVAATPHFAIGRVNPLPLTMALPVGSVGVEPTRLVLTQDGEQLGNVPPNNYVFQRGDIYRSFRIEEGASFTLGSPAAGVREHLSGLDVILSPKGPPESDDLLLV